MTSSTPRRCYLSRVVHVGLLSHDTGTSLTHRLPLRLTEPTLTQYSPFFPITTDYHLKTFTTPPSHPARYTRCNSPPINDHCTNHRIADPQTKIHTYSTTKKTIHHQHHRYHNTPVLHVTVTSYKPLPLHNAYSKTYIISYIQYISCTNIN